MIGYHYTSFENWEQIQKRGLIPYKIDKQELKKRGFKKVHGIWIYFRELTKDEEDGTVLQQAQKKSTVHLVKLKVSYEPEWVFTTKDHRTILLSHYGSVIDQNGNNHWQYHNGVPAVIIKCRIAPENIEFVRDFELIEMFEISS